MRLSPPICTLLVLAVAVAAITWVAPMKTPHNTTLTVPSGVYRDLMAWGQTQSQEPSHPMTAGRTIDLLLAMQRKDADTDDIELRKATYSPRIDGKSPTLVNEN